MDAPPRLAAVVSVCCLDCGKTYAKPSGGGTLSKNPGCPHCGYLGWLPHSERIREAWPRARFGADRPRRQSARSG